jgi:glucosamine-6-phosphate deaminase
MINGNEKDAIDIARLISNEIQERQSQNRHIVLGLATGSTPIKLYKELVRLHKEEDLSFKNVYTFNLDEYCELKTKEQQAQSYSKFMHEHLWDHIDIPESNIFIPNANTEDIFLRDYCNGYEQAINDLGGIDIQILGIGRSGHIGFNEPGSSINSKTRKVKLHIKTREDASEAFGGIDNVPTHAITMGISTILSAKKIIFMSYGENKSEITRRALFGEISEDVPASFIQTHAGDLLAYINNNENKERESENEVIIRKQQKEV